MTLIKRILPALAGALGFVCANLAFAEEAAPPQLVAETFACSYKDGKDWNDKKKAVDNLEAQLEKAGLPKVPAFHWTRTRGLAPVDTVWFDIYPNFGAFAEASDNWDASGIGANVNAAFDKVEDCDAGLSVIRPVFQREGENTGQDGPTVVVNLACGYKDGAGPGNLPDLGQHIGQVLQSFGDNSPNFAAMRTPITNGANYPDVFLFYVFDNNVQWANYAQQLFGTEAGQSMRNHLGMVLDCSISTWSASMVMAPDA